jgi:ribosomal-protein-alanine N-acetyltransferase
MTLWEIDQKCFAPGISYSRLELASYMRRPGSFTVVAEAVRSGAKERQKSGPATPRILGFITGEAGRRGVGHIITIDVLPEARRSGLGSKLLGVCEERLKAAQCALVMLETAVDNEAALAFYKRHRYEVLKTIARYYANGVDALVLQKDLLSSDPAS